MSQNHEMAGRILHATAGVLAGIGGLCAAAAAWRTAGDPGHILQWIPGVNDATGVVVSSREHNNNFVEVAAFIGESALAYTGIDRAFHWIRGAFS